MSLFRRPLGSLLPFALLAAPALAAPGCAADVVSGHGITLDDPLGLVMDVARSGHPLRLYVLPASSYTCDTSATSMTVGEITPPIGDDDMPGSVPDAIVDVVIPLDGTTDSVQTRAMVPAGDWVVLVRGKGTDPVSGTPNSVIASGCSLVSGFSGQGELGVMISLQPKHTNGRCNDGVLSPDEQCEPPNSTLCDATCHTTPFTVNVNLANGTAPHMSTATGQRIAVAFDSAATSNDIGVRLLDMNGNMVGSTGTSLARDEKLDDLGMPLPGPQNAGHPAMATDGRFALAFANLFPASGDDSDIMVQFFSADRAPMATTPVRTPSTGNQTAADAAYAASGALMVVYQDTMSATGIAATFFPSGATSASMSGVDIGTGLTGATHPVVAGLASGFVVAFSAGTDVYYQRFAADGSTRDAAPVAVLDATDAIDTQDQPAVAANSDGSFLVAWTEHSVANGDGMGTSIRARAFGVAGTPAGMALTLPTTGAAGDQSVPSVAAADGRYIVAWSSTGSVHARIVSGTGAALPNREQPQTTNDFVVAAAGNAPSAIAMGSMPASWLVGYDDGSHVSVRRYPR